MVVAGREGMRWELPPFGGSQLQCALELPRGWRHRSSLGFGTVASITWCRFLCALEAPLYPQQNDFPPSAWQGARSLSVLLVTGQVTSLHFCKGSSVQGVGSAVWSSPPPECSVLCGKHFTTTVQCAGCCSSQDLHVSLGSFRRDETYPYHPSLTHFEF